MIYSLVIEKDLKWYSGIRSLKWQVPSENLDEHFLLGVSYNLFQGRSNGLQSELSKVCLVRVRYQMIVLLKTLRLLETEEAPTQGFCWHMNLFSWRTKFCNYGSIIYWSAKWCACFPQWVLQPLQDRSQNLL